MPHVLQPDPDQDPLIPGAIQAAWRHEEATGEGQHIDMALMDVATSVMANQALNVSTVYWEGAVAFEGTRDGAPISAEGYIELTGYAGSMEGRL